ncbi:unnamed protein product [Mycena citricolor]|uniref:Aminotransferase class I/classII large domain-containing protein n=1 Tax=Mycena citricolor TaxID=2018698 RepID=A0AAD2H5E1_9AGAR|nr:unnamed protein product [Mycena citricolor]CAK5269616.1 unnamed protein product [Mycena citricolor]
MPHTTSIPSLSEDFYTPFLSDVAKARLPSPIRSLFPLENLPGMISLLAGKPNPYSFPFTSFKFGTTAPGGQARGGGEELELSVSGDDLTSALQYGPTAGMPALLQWLAELQEHVHGRSLGEGWQVIVGTGSQDLLAKAITALLNPGDSVLVQSPIYAGVIPLFHSLNCEQIEIEGDADGISSSSLRLILESWPAEKPKPRVLYTIPYGGNPTGSTASLERRREVLRLANEHNFLIMEDDPYYFLFYGKERAPSYFALERTESELVGRVLRFDSFSKILSAGMRLGFLSGPTPILRAIEAHTATSNLQTSSLVQVISAKLLSAWGVDGFMLHTAGVSNFYREKRDIFQAAMVKHLSGLAEWTAPEAGLFFWFKLNLAGSGDDSAELIRTKAVQHGVLALPGTAFLPNGRKSAYVRAAFSLLTPEQVDEALKRLRETILEVRQ